MSNIKREMEKITQENQTNTIEGIKGQLSLDNIPARVNLNEPQVKAGGLNQFGVKQRTTLPFMPNGWENDIQKYMDEGKKNPHKNKRFEKICRMSQAELREYCKNVLKTNKYSVIERDGFLLAEGDYPVLLCAHLDTVHNKRATQFIYRDKYLTCPQGIGGDDRCGIYMILNLIEHHKYSVLFLEDEEMGCIGASIFCATNFPKRLRGNINYIIELDRKGTTDCVFYDCDNKDFIEFCESTGYFKMDIGSCSDISYIAPKIGVAAVNLSSGYFDEHMKEEYVDMEAMKTILKEVLKLTEEKVEKPFEYIESPNANHWNKAYEHYCEDYGYYGGYLDGCGYYDCETDEYYDEDEYLKEKQKGISVKENYRINVNRKEDLQKLYGVHSEYKQKVYHLWVFDEDAMYFDNCYDVVEVKAVSSDEAVGIFLQKFNGLCASDIIKIVSES